MRKFSRSKPLAERGPVRFRTILYVSVRFRTISYDSVRFRTNWYDLTRKCTARPHGKQASEVSTNSPAAGLERAGEGW